MSSRLSGYGTAGRRAASDPGVGVIILDRFSVRRRLAALRADRHRLIVGRHVRRQEGIRRLVMVASSSWRWPMDDLTCERHGALLRTLLTAGTGGRGALARPTDGELMGAADTAAPTPRAGSVTSPHWHWALGPDLHQAIDAVVLDLQAFCRQARECGIEALNGGLGELRHRVYLDATRFQAGRGRRAPTPADLDHHVVLDLRLTTYLDELACMVSVAVWTQFPADPDHAPPPRTVPSRLRREGLLNEYLDLCQRVRGDVEQCFAGTGLLRTEFRIRQSEYLLPTMWVAMPHAPERDAGDYAHRRGGLINDLAALTLGVGDARDSVVTHSVLNGGLLALRHFQQVAPGKFVPSYLLVPEQVAPHDRSGRLQERMVAEIVRALVGLEGQAAERLWRINADIDVWSNQLDVYDEVAERGLVLWDALSTHLPVRRGRQLERVHRAVELVHQILLQGVADLARMETKTQDCVTSVQRVSADLQAAYDETITEYHAGTADGLRDALARVGVMGEVRQTAERAVERATRVKSKYDYLLNAIASAFDERRVRESDVVQRASGKVGFALAFIGGITLLDATVQMKPERLGTGAYLLAEHQWLSALALVASIAFGLGFVALVAWVALTAVGEGPLGSSWFRRRYNGERGGGRDTGMWPFLRDSSSDMLDALKVAAPGGGVDPATWRHHDDDLSARFAALWDSAGDPHLPRREVAVRRDIETLSRRVEQWGLRALLVTERPFGSISRYRLPRLTLLYRACTWLPDSFLTGSTASVVSENDCLRSLQQLGLSWEQAREVDAALNRRVCGGGRTCTAAEALALIDSWGVRADMGPNDVDTLLDRVRTGADA